MTLSFELILKREIELQLKKTSFNNYTIKDDIHTNFEIESITSKLTKKKKDCSIIILQERFKNKVAISNYYNLIGRPSKNLKFV